MTKSDKIIDQIACDLCWAGFYDPKSAGCTKRQYWAKVCDAARQGYRDDARRLLSMVRRLGIERIQAALASTES